MRDNELERVKKAIESMNQEYFDLQHSKEYRIGKKILSLFSMTPQKLFSDYRTKKNVQECSRYNQQLNYANTTKREYCGTRGRTIIYTCVTGNYDTVKDPLYLPDDVDFVLYTEKANVSNIGHELKIWQVRELPKMPTSVNTPAMMNRYLKLHPHEFFESYDYSIYLDGNVRVVGDICSLLCNTRCKTGLALHRHRQRESVFFEAEVCKLLGKGNAQKINDQMSRYRIEKFPDNFGLYEATVIATDLSNNIAAKLFDAWWEELIRSKSGRDQLSLPYVIWKNGYAYEDVGNLGNNLYDNRIFQIVTHK